MTRCSGSPSSSVQKNVVKWRNYFFSHNFSPSRKESMPFIPLLSELPGCSFERVSQTGDAIFITACATTSSACCSDCQQHSSQVHSSYTRSPRAMLSSGRAVRLLLRVRRFRCPNPICQRKTFAGPRSSQRCSPRPAGASDCRSLGDLGISSTISVRPWRRCWRDIMRM